jgi:hypothetical protein
MRAKFEKDIEQQLNDFSLEPSPQVWLDVENALHPRHVNRGIVWWWVPLWGLLLAGAGGGWWLLHDSVNKTKRNIPSAVSQNKKPAVSLSATGTLQSAEKKNATATKESAAVRIKQTGNERQEIIKQVVNGNSAITGTAETVAENKYPAAGKRAGEIKEDADLSVPAGPLSSAMVPGRTVAGLPHAVIKPGLPVITPGGTTTSNRHTGKGSPDWWLLTAGIGKLHDNQMNLFTRGQNTTTLANSAPGGPYGGSTAIPSPKNGVTFFAGIIYQHHLSRNWIFNAGLQYRYLQNKQPVGFDSLAGMFNYFKIGDTASKTNYSRWLQLPLTLGFTINPSARNRFQLLLGGSFAWAFAEKWLITGTDNASYPYHYNTSLNNHFIFNLQAGVSYNYNDRFQISLLAEQSLTPIHKVSAEKFYWQQFSLQISKPLRFSSHKHPPSKT